MIFFYLIFFILLCIACKKYKSPIVNFILLFYLFASVAGIIVHYFIEYNTYATILSTVFQLTVFYLFLKPIIEYGKNEKKRLFIHPSDKSFKTISYTLILLQAFSIIYFARFVFSLLSMGDLSAVRSNLITGGDLNLEASMFRTIAGTASFYYCFNILFFFYSLAFRKDNRWFILLLIITSSSRIFHSLTYMGRDGILFWILSFISTYFIFKRYLSPEKNELIKKYFIIIGTFAIILLGLITLSRFGENGGMLNSLIQYFGSPIDNFGQLFDKYNEDFKGFKGLLPIFYGEKGALGAEVIQNAENFKAKYGFYSNIFFSFVGSFYKSLGAFFTLIISFGYSILMTNLLRRRQIDMSTLIILMVATQIVLHNYFYWAYYIRVANLFLLTVPLFCFYFKRIKL